MSIQYVFAFNDKLPWKHEVVSMVMDLAPGGAAAGSGETALRKKVMYQLTRSLIELWIKAFGDDNLVLSYKSVRKRIVNLLQGYNNCVTKISKSSDDHRKACYKNKTPRQLLRDWRNDNSSLFNIFRDNVDPQTLDYESRTFFLNQQAPGRVGYITDKVDEEYEEQRRANQHNVSMSSTSCSESDGDRQESDFEMEVADIHQLRESAGNVSSHTDSISELSTNRSGTVRFLEADDTFTVSTPNKIRKGKRCFLNEDVKSACARVSYVTGCSVDKAIDSTIIVCEELYGDTFYRSKKEKQDALGSEMVSTEDVFPARQTITRYVGLLAATEEANAGKCLFALPDKSTATLSFDTTKRNNVDGEWMSLILETSDGERYDLRAISFAYEDRENISLIIAETFKRIAAAGSVLLKTEVSAIQLWNKITFLSTDSVSKNHHIGGMISRILDKEVQLVHEPIHTFCKSHTAGEGIDEKLINVLQEKLEVPVKLKSTLETNYPSLRFYFRNSSIVEAGMRALVKLVTPDVSANSCSLSEHFADICTSQGQNKKMILKFRRRFTKVGSCAAAILQVLPIFEQLLQETPAENLLAQACRVYVHCDIFITELRMLAYFGQLLSFPLLNSVEKLNAEELLNLLPLLHKQLLQDKTTLLKEYEMKSGWQEVFLSGDLEQKLHHLMCQAAAECLQLQCGREYGFASSKEAEGSRATDLTKVPKATLRQAPTNNLVCERQLSLFSRYAETAKFRNRKHTGQTLRDKMVLASTPSQRLPDCAKTIKSVLSIMNIKWNEAQETLRKERLKEKLKKKQQHTDYVLKLLTISKTWGGPCTTQEELLATLQAHPGNYKKVISTELALFIHMHPHERASNPQLFRQVKVSVEEKVENLCILLSGHHDSSVASPNINLPSNDDALAVLTDQPIVSTVFETNELCVTMWWENDSVAWYIGYFKEVTTENEFLVEHLTRKSKQQSTFWVHAPNEVCDNVESEQVLKLENGKRFPVVGQWNFERNNTFCLKNMNDIVKRFNSVKGTWQSQ